MVTDMKTTWGNKRIYRLLVWAGFRKSPLFHFAGITPTLRMAWTGIISDGEQHEEN